RPVDLSIIDGIHAQAVNMGTSGLPLSPGLLVAGSNPVSTDAVGAALMGFDPMADRGQVPFEYCDSHLKLAEDAGIGSRDLSRIEVAGPPIHDIAYNYRAQWRKHGIGPRRPPRRRE
ncbi:MAG: hypothetical protein GY778_00515, partial [bacterium]|nr:hypothetical protein [bacterium]